MRERQRTMVLTVVLLFGETGRKPGRVSPRSHDVNVTSRDVLRADALPLLRSNRRITAAPRILPWPFIVASQPVDSCPLHDGSHRQWSSALRAPPPPRLCLSF